MLIEQLPKGHVPDPADERDFRAEVVMGGAPVIDYATGFRLDEPPDADQGQSDACVSYSSSFYHWWIKRKVFSKRDLFSRIALGYGAFIRDGVLEIVKRGQLDINELPDPVSPTPQNMRDRTGIDETKGYDDKEFKAFALPNQNIDYLAEAIKTYGGFVFGVRGTNKGWQNLTVPEPPVPNEGDVWGHALYAMGYHLHDGEKCIIAKSSWCNSGVKEHHIRERYFTSYNTNSAWVLIPNAKIMTKKFRLQDGEKLGIAISEGFTLTGIYADSIEHYNALCATYGITDQTPLISLPQ